MSRRRRLQLLCLTGGLLIWAAAAYVHYHLYLPIGTGPAGPPVPLGWWTEWREPFTHNTAQ